MSNNFPKVSPDGKWIVFVECKNGLLMRPDSQLYIVPAKGGTARRLQANAPLMNSWHSFSPNGRWLVFASKGRSLFTQMYLTHIDQNGNDSPAILIDNATAANRAVNIPEFVNVPPGGLARMDAPATEFYRLCDVATDLAKKGRLADSIAEWKKAVAMEPDDPKARYNLGVSLQNQGQTEQAAAEYRKSIELNPDNALAYTNLGVALAGAGKFEEAIDLYQKAISVDPANAKAEANLAAALVEKGQLAQAIDHCRRSVAIDPAYAEARNTLGIALARSGQLDEGIEHLERAVASSPESFEYRYNLGRVLAAKHRFADAIPHFEKAVELSGGKEPTNLDLLAAMYSEVGRYRDAVATANRALDAANAAGNSSLAQALRARIARYQSQAAGSQ